MTGKISRRRFVYYATGTIAAITVGSFLADYTIRSSSQSISCTLNPCPATTRTEATFYDTLPLGYVRCEVCYRTCVVREGARGFCRSRENSGGKYYSLVYGRPVAIHIDPIEKLPLRHVLPGTDTLCVGTACCNFDCLYCINWNIALKSPEEVEAFPKSPHEIVQMALDHDVPTVCFTYNEPTVAYEYVHDVFRLAREKGLTTCIHSNGSMRTAPLEALLPSVDAIVVDLKAFTPDLYRKISSGEMSPVLEFLENVKRSAVWLEIVNLLVPTLNDDLESIGQMCSWILNSLGPDVPLHFSRFFPAYKLEKLSPTPVGMLEAAYQVARDSGLNYAYVNNVPSHRYGNTFCPRCGEQLIERKEFVVKNNYIIEGRCKFCGNEIPGLWRTSLTSRGAA